MTAHLISGAALSFMADHGKVYLTCGTVTAYVTQDQADRYAALFFEGGLVRQFNDLTDAMQAAGYVPWGRRLAA